jgi:hydrogenase maturation protease
LADDAFGLMVGEKLRPLATDAEDIVASSESGFRLIDYLLGVSRVVVIDTVQTGKADPGTIFIVNLDDFRVADGASPHYVGLSETLALGRCLDLPVAEELIVIAVEASDCVTVGGDMNEDVRAAIPRVVELVEEFAN